MPVLLTPRAGLVTRFRNSHLTLLSAVDQWVHQSGKAGRPHWLWLLQLSSELLSFSSMAMNGKLNGHMSEEFDGKAIEECLDERINEHRLHNPYFYLDATLQATRLHSCSVR
jgi:hypothetical protein